MLQVLKSEYGLNKLFRIQNLTFYFYDSKRNNLFVHCRILFKSTKSKWKCKHVLQYSIKIADIGLVHTREKNMHFLKKMYIFLKKHAFFLEKCSEKLILKSEKLISYQDFIKLSSSSSSDHVFVGTFSSYM